MVIKSKTKKKIIIAVCIVLAVIIIFAIVGYFVLRYFTATARQPGEITANAVVQTDKVRCRGVKITAFITFSAWNMQGLQNFFSPPSK